MPTFNDIEVTVRVDVDFEVFCACGAHLCNETGTRSSRTRGTPQAVVNACQDCIDRATAPLLERIEDLKQELADLSAES